jgi:hypothetical protein
MATSTQSPNYFEMIGRTDNSAILADRNQLADNISFCKCCGEPLVGVNAIPDLIISKMIRQSDICDLNVYKGGPVHAISETLVGILNQVIDVSKYFMFGNLRDTSGQLIDDYVSYLTKYRLYIRGSTFFEKTCECCDFLIYNYYRDHYLPLSILDVDIPVFGTVGSGIALNQEIYRFVKSHKPKKVSFYRIKFQEELPQNSQYPLYTTHY